MSFEKTDGGKVVLYRKSDGQRFERWSVDARDMYESGSYSLTPIEDKTVTPAKEAPAAPAEEKHDPLAAPVTAAQLGFQDTAGKEHSPGVPLVVVKSVDAPPAAPVSIPAGHTSTRKGR